MTRLRGNGPLGSWLALFALAIQLVLSFGHVHLGNASGPGQFAVQQSGASGINSTADNDEGAVSRQVFLGSHRDYLIDLSNGETVRAVAPPDIAIPKGQPVWLQFPP